MTTAVIYSNGSQECERMGMLLQDLKNIDEYLEYRLDKHFSQKSFIDEFGEEATFPQIAIGNKHIGGMKEALRYMSDKGMFLWYNTEVPRGSGGIGRHTRLKICWLLQSCEFKSRLPYSATK